MTNKTTTPNQTFEFRVLLGGTTAISEVLENALYEAGCNDALLWSQGAVVGLDFSRQAPSFDEAVASARLDIAQTKLGLTVESVEAIED